MIEREPFVKRGLGPGLRIDELEFVALCHDEPIPGLGADAEPVDARGHRQGAIGLDRDLETARVQRLRQRGIDLQQRLAPGEHDEGRAARGLAACALRPKGGDGLGQRRGIREAAAARPVHSHEIGIAEAAGGARPVLLAAGPEVAAGKTAEDRRAAGIPPLALQSVEDFLDRIGHRSRHQYCCPDHAGRRHLPCQAALGDSPGGEQPRNRWRIARHYGRRGRCREIRLLPSHVVDRIAAGEVVERPAAAIKELVENALDAGARRITIALQEGGIRRIDITDDGCGMGPEELPLAIQRHATSKLTEAGDLVNITTLGFRGEALPSIGAAARLAITSRPAGADSAHTIRVEGGMVRAVEPAAGQPGTHIVVSDLFFATPARRAFLRSPRVEADHAEAVIRRLALPPWRRLPAGA